MAGMRANPLLWLVPAGIVMAFGVSSTTIAIINHELALHMAGPNTILVSGISAIALGLVVNILGYYSEVETSSKVESVFTRLKGKNVGFNRNEDSESKSCLDSVIDNTLQLTKKLVRLGNLIHRYNTETPPKDWQIVRYYATRSKDEVGELCKRIILDFAQIVDLMENPLIARSFGIQTLYYSRELIDQTLKIDPESDKELLSDLRGQISEQVGQLKKALELLDAEKRRINDFC
jgi:hypothetical protein